jgi:hypothetical protein
MNLKSQSEAYDFFPVDMRNKSMKRKKTPWAVYLKQESYKQLGEQDVPTWNATDQSRLCHQLEPMEKLMKRNERARGIRHHYSGFEGEGTECEYP